MSKDWDPIIRVIGLPQHNCEELIREFAEECDGQLLILGAPRVLSELPQEFYDDPQIFITAAYGEYPSPAELIDDWNQGTHIIVMASGNPLFFGVGSRLIERYENVECFPGLSCLEMASAKMGLPSNSVIPLSILVEDPNIIKLYAELERPLAILLKNGEQLATACAMLPANWRVHLFHALGMEEEQWLIFPADNPPEIESSLVMMVAMPEASSTRLPMMGLPDDLFLASGPMTKHNARAMVVSLSAQCQAQNPVIFDLGAGSGSVGLEIARFFALQNAGRAVRSGDMYGTRLVAIEKNATRAKEIEVNAEARGLKGAVTVVNKELSLDSFSDALVIGDGKADIIYYGGGLSKDFLLTSMHFLSPGGILIVPAVTVESQTLLMDYINDEDWDFQAVSFSNLKEIGSFHAFQPALPLVYGIYRKPLE
ncbi:MAG: SAM-dependent methyltransferase [Corynebacterium sp.]|nr:SAM-dependent methyltransferase [Corynebacterium sp.]